MALKTFVKVGNISNLSDARYCAGMGVDLLGFSIDEGVESYVDPIKFMEIKGWLEGVRFVLETEKSNLDTDLEKYDADFVQISDPQLIHSDQLAGKEIILNLDLTEKSTDECVETMNKLSDQVKYFQLESSGSEVNFKNIKSLIDNFPTLIGFGIDENNLEILLSEYNLTGISLKGSEELKPGFKDYDQLADILEYLETED